MSGDGAFAIPTIRRGLAGLRRKARLALGLRGGASLALALVGLSLLSFGLDRTLRLSWGTRATILVVCLTGLAVLLWTRLLRPLLAALSDAELARVVERKNPDLDWRLLSAVEFAGPTWSPGPSSSRELAGLVVADAEVRARTVPFTAAVPWGPLLRHALRGAVVLAAGVALVTGFDEAAGTWFRRNVLLSTTAAWPKDTTLELDSEHEEEAPHFSLARGDDLMLSVVAKGVVPARVYLDAVSADGEVERIPFDAVGEDRFRLTLQQVAEGFTFEVWGGDDRIGPYEVRVNRRPWIEDLAFAVTPPAYTGQPARRFGLEAGSVSLPLDTEVEVVVRTSKPLVAASLEELAVGAGEPAAIGTTTLAADGRGFRCTFGLERTGVFTVAVRDVDGLELEEPTRFSLVAEPDDAPQVGLRLAGVGLNVTPEATVRFAVEAEDDYALTGGELRLRGTGGGEGVEEAGEARPLEGLEGEVRSRVGGALELEGLKLVEGMALTLWAEATDADPRGPNTGASPAHQLRVVSAERLLNELLRRLHEQRLELERMVAEEEKLAQGLVGLDATVLERAARTHRDVGRALLRAAEVVEGIVEEMVSNRLLDESTWRRLREGVAAPLRGLEEGDLSRARTLAEAAAAAPPEARAAASQQAGRAAGVVVDELRAIVARMGRIEDLAELVAALKGIIQRQRDLLDETRRED